MAGALLAPCGGRYAAIKPCGYDSEAGTALATSGASSSCRYCR